MADFLLTGGLDLSPAEKEVKEFMAFLRKESASADAAATQTGADVPAKTSGADKARLDAQKKLIDAQAKLVALKQMEAKIDASTMGSGRTVSKSTLAGIKDSGLKEIQGAIPGMTPAQKARFTKAVNAQIASMESQLSGLSGDDLEAGFAKIVASLNSQSTSAAQTAAAGARETKAATQAANIQEKKAKTLGQQYSEIQKELNAAVKNAAKAKTVTEKAAAGAEIKKVLEKEAGFTSSLDSSPRKYNPLNIDDQAPIRAAERRREEQKRTGRFGTTSGGFGAAELQTAGDFPLQAFTEALKTSGKKSVKFLDDLTGKVTDFAGFLGDIDMSNLMEEFGVTRGKGKNQATYTIADRGRAEEFQTRANALLEQKKAQRLAEVADERLAGDSAESIARDRRKIEEGKGTPEQVAAAEAVFAKEMLDAKADLEKLGLSTNEVRTALVLLSSSLRAEAGQVAGLVEKGIASPGTEWTGPRVKNINEPSVGLDSPSEERIIDQLMAEEVTAQKRITEAKQKEASAAEKSAQKEVLKRDEVIPPVQPKKDVVRVGPREPIDVQSASEAEKRAHVQAYAKGRLADAARGTTGTDVIEAGMGQAKEEELLAAREAARIEKEATARLAEQTARQAAAEARTTKAKESESATEVISTPQGDFVRIEEVINKEVLAEQVKAAKLKEQQDQQVAAETEVTAAKRRKVRLAQAEADVLKGLLATEKNPVGKVVGKDFVYDANKAEDVQAYFENQKRISASAGSTFGRGQERLGVASSRILTDVDSQLVQAKNEEAYAAKLAAGEEKRAAERAEVENAKQLAAEKKITKLKESYFTDYSSAAVDPSSGYISNLATRSDKRGKGEASKVMRQITDDADAIGQKLFLSARDDLEGFYNQFGFQKTDQKAFGQPVYERLPLAEAALASEEKALAQQTAEDVKQTAAEKKITEAKTEQATAAKKLSAAQARAVNLVADGGVTKDQLKAQGVKASTVRSLEKTGAISEKPDGTLQASDAAIVAAKQTQLGAVQKQTAAETQAAAAASTAAAKEAELVALKDKLNKQVSKGIITAQEANAKFLTAGGRGTFDASKSAVPVSELEPAAPRKRRTRDQIIHDEEGGLVEALRRKIKALNAQARVLEQKYPAFSAAEALLIDALNRKARALQKQIQAIEAGEIVVQPQVAASKPKKVKAEETTTTPPTGVTPVPDTGSTKPKSTPGGTPKGLGLDDFFDDNSDVTAAEEQADAARISAANIEKTAAEAKSLEAQKVLADALDADYAAVIAAEDAAEAARIAAAGRQQRTTAQATVVRTEQPTSSAAAAATAAFQANQVFATGEKAPAAVKLDRQYTNKNIPDGFDELDVDQTQAAEAAVARAFIEYAQIIGLISSEFVDDFVDLKAATQALRARLNGMISTGIIDSDVYLGDAARGKAESTVANTVIGAASKAEILGDETLQQRYIQAKLELIGLTKAEAQSITLRLADDPAELKSAAELLMAKNQYSAALLRAARETEGVIGSGADVLTQRTMNRALVKQEALNNPQYLESLRLDQVNRLQERRARSGNPQGMFGKITQGLGYDRSGGGSLTEFFGGGALSSLRYGLPSMLLYGAGSGIANTIKEAEELQYNLSRLEGQFNAVFAGEDFGPIRKQILGVAKDTGLAADEIANLQIQLTGAFGTGVEIGGLKGEDLVKSQVESAAKLAQTVALPLAEITDGLTAASLAFNASFEDIGDVALALEEESGVLAKETVSFIGDIAPVAKEAGYSLEEFSAIAAVAQQRSGRSGTALAESFGRVIPALTEQKDKLLELAAIEPSLGSDKFLDAIRESNPKAILDEIGKSYANMSKEGQQATVNLLGGRREAQAIIPAIANQALVSRYVRDAEESAGTLEKRFKKVQETLTNSVQRIGEAVRQLGVELLEAGLSDVFDKAISGANLLLKAVSPIVKAIGAVNEALGGIPISILVAVGAYKLLSRAMSRVPLDPNTGLPMVGANGQLVERVPRFDRERLTSRDTYTPRIVSDYRDRRRLTPNFDPGRGRIPYYTEPGSIPVRAAGPPSPAFDPGQSRLAAGFGAARTSGKNFLKAFDITGGGSAAAGGAFLGITALAALYGWANGQISKEKAELEELNQEIQEGNSNVDFDIPGARESRVEELRAQAEEARNALKGWSKFWTDLGGVMTQEELLLGQAEALDTSPEFREAEKVLSESTSLRSDLFKDFGVKLGEKTGQIRTNLEKLQSLQEVVEASGGEAEDIVKKTSKSGVTTYSYKNATTASFTEQQMNYLNALAEAAGTDIQGLDSGFAQAASLGDGGRSILELAKGDKDAIDKYGSAAVEQAKAYVEYIYGVAASSGDYAAEIDGILAGLTAITPIEESKLNLEQLAASFDLGLIGLEEYSLRLNQQIDILKRQIAAGDKTSATELQLLNLEQQKAQAEKAISDAFTSRQENLKKIAEALGVKDSDLQQSTIVVGLANLNNPAFTDNDARLQAAIEITEAKKNFDLKAAYDAGNMAEVERIYAEGITLPPEIRSVFFTSQLEANDDWQAFINDYDQIVEDAKSFSSDLDGALSEFARSKNKDMFGDFDGETMAENVFTEVFDDVAGVSDGLKKSLESQANFFQNQLSNEGLTEDQRKALENSLALVIALMNFAGYSVDQINAALGGPGTVGGTDVAGIIGDNTGDNNPLGAPPPATAQLDPAELAKRQDSVEEAKFEYRRAVADQNSLEIAQINKEAADRERWRAETGEFETEEERQAAIWTAKANQVKAGYEERDAYKALSDSRFEYLQAVAEVNGNMLEVAQLEVQKLLADLELARASGDPNADAIAGQLLVAQDKVRQQLLESRGLDFDLFATYLEGEGDIVNAALTRVKKAEFDLANAKPGDDSKRAQMELINAQNALKQAQATERNSAYGLFSTVIAKEDPVAQAKIAVALAKENLAAAEGAVAKADAQKALIEAQRAAEDAMASARLSMFSLRQAELAAMDDQIGAAGVAVEMARQQLNDAISQGQGAAAINQARANLITTEKQLQDTMLNEKMDEYKWLLDMGKITQSQYINYLEALQSTLAPGSKQFKDLALTLKQLKDNISGDLQANLPTSLRLPTLYEVRRFDQTGASSGGATALGGIGYQDNRVVQPGAVNITVNGGDANVAEKVAAAVNEVIGTNNTGYGVRRY